MPRRKKRARTSRKKRVSVAEVYAERYEKSRQFTCKKCDANFSSRMELGMHDSHVHMSKVALEEIKLLEQGFIPEETKLGTKFKGKNRVVIA